MKFTYRVLLVFAVSFSKTCIDATICKPLSTFKIDCDECQCSEDGTEYSCTARQCQPSSIRDADEKDSYIIDNPPDDNNPKHEKVEFAYLNDEVPSSSEIDDHVFDIDSSEWINFDYDRNEPDNSDEEWDTGLPEDYRRKKRYVRPGKRYVRPGKRYVRPGKRYVHPIGR